MRHGVGGYKLKRPVDSRNALLRNLITSVIDEERVITTVPKAKAVKPLVDKMITLAKTDTLHTRRQAAAVLRTPASVKKLFDTLGTRFGQRNGGYTRITRLGPRKGDGAEQAMLELVGSELVKRAADRAKRREERLKARQQGLDAWSQLATDILASKYCRPMKRGRQPSGRRAPSRSSAASPAPFARRPRSGGISPPPRTPRRSRPS